MIKETRLPLTRARIVQEALALLDETGEDGFSMRRLAARLRVDPMAVYHHLPNKAAVLHEAIDRMTAECEIPSLHESWSDRIRALCRSCRGIAHRHPKAFPMLCAQRSWTENEHRVNEGFLSACLESGLSPADAVRAASSFLGYSAGFSLDELTGALRPLSDEERDRLRALPAALYPATAQLLSHLLDVDPDAEFEFGLDVMIAGVAARATRAP